MSGSLPHYFHRFEEEVAQISLPKQFTYPFCYEPHPLSITAVKQVQHYLGKQTDFDHNFGLDDEQNGLAIGKMFGVLVVLTDEGELGFIAAVSGKLANQNRHRYFVPPVYDLLDKNGFFLEEETIINGINARISTFENDPLRTELQIRREQVRSRAADELKVLRDQHKENKVERKAIRAKCLPEGESAEDDALRTDLIKQSYRDQHDYAVAKARFKQELDQIDKVMSELEGEISALKNERRTRSAELQAKIFAQYRFLDAHGMKKDLLDIFDDATQSIPPAGAGECAAPKLLQYAYTHGLRPICMGEFWWGASPSSEIRRHQQYYPACRGKCEPILAHMLQGIEVEQNPLIIPPSSPIHTLDVLYEDDDIIVIDKPAEFLSVPGKHITDSVYSLARDMRPEMTGPIIVHRLDMSTSGILVLAKHKDAHQHIQDQFIKKTVSKRYTALLEGDIADEEGIIDLPLRVDLDDRPRQMVCYEYGKRATTRYKVVHRHDGRTRVHFFPITGRTHQLRVHAAHKLGLHSPIVGDDLYGSRSNRLHLHAGFLAFSHPRTAERVEFSIPDPF